MTSPDMTPQRALAELQRTALMQPPPSVAVEAVEIVAEYIGTLSDRIAEIEGVVARLRSALRSAGVSDALILAVMAE